MRKKLMLTLLVIISLTVIPPTYASPLTYEVCYQPLNGTEIGNLTDIVWNQAYLLPNCAMAKTGYVFDGWYTGENGLGVRALKTSTYSDLVRDDESQMSVVLYANWVPKTGYRIKYETGCEYVIGDMTGVAWDQAGLLPQAALARDGYVFEGWYAEPDGGGRMITDEVAYCSLAGGDDSRKDVTLYAHWRYIGIYRVAYYYNNIMDEAMSVTLTAPGSPPTVSDVPLKGKEKAGYRLADAPYTTPALPTVISAMNNVIRVDFVTDESQRYNYEVAYFYDGVADPSLTERLSVQVISALVGEVPLAGKDKKGYALVENPYVPKLPVTLSSGGRVIEVHYAAIKYAIKYNLNGGANDADNPDSYTVADNIILKNPTMAGYKFDGWSPSGNVPAGSTGDREFAAKWVRAAQPPATGGSGPGGGAPSVTPVSTPAATPTPAPQKPTAKPTPTLTPKPSPSPTPPPSALASPARVRPPQTPPPTAASPAAGTPASEPPAAGLPPAAGSPFAGMPPASTQPPDFIAEHIKYINGYKDGSIQPDAVVTRAETSAIFYRLINDVSKDDEQPPLFTDVPDNEWYSRPINYLAGRNLIFGYRDGEFKPESPITRAEFCALIAGLGGLSERTAGMFNDVEGHWAAGCINGAAEAGWISGYPDGSFRPESGLSRAEIVTAVNRMLSRRLDIGDIPDWAPVFVDIDESHWAYADIIEASVTHEYVRKDAEGREIWTNEFNLIEIRRN